MVRFAKIPRIFRENAPVVEQVNRFVGPAYTVRLEHVQDAQLEAVCLCGHVAPLDVAELTKRFSKHERLVDLEHRSLRCTKCGMREAGVTIRVTFPVPGV